MVNVKNGEWITIKPTVLQSTLNFFGWLCSNMSLKVVIFFSVVLGLGFLYFCGKWTKKYDRQQPYHFGKFDFRTVSWMTFIWSDFVIQAFSSSFYFSKNLKSFKLLDKLEQGKRIFICSVPLAPYVWSFTIQDRKVGFPKKTSW